jgi:DNA-binding transcriptional regulator YiaG
MLDYEGVLKYLFLAPGIALAITSMEDTVTKYSLEEKAKILQKNLYSIRKLSGIKASVFAKNLHISKQALNNWEGDKNKNAITPAQYGISLSALPAMGLTNPLLRCSTKTYATILFITFFPEYFTKEDFSNYQEIIAMLGSLANKSNQPFFNDLVNELPSEPPFDMKTKFDEILFMPEDDTKNTELDERFLVWSSFAGSLILFSSASKQGIITPYTIKEKMEILRSNIVNIRKLSGLTAESFAEYLHITKQTLNKWESDKYKNKLYFFQYALLISVLPFIGLTNDSLQCSKKTYASILFTILCPEYFTKEKFSYYQAKIPILCDLARFKNDYLARFEKIAAELPATLPFNIKLKYDELYNTSVDDLYALSGFDEELV